MGFFRRSRKPETVAGGRPRGACECREHVDGLLDLEVPAAGPPLGGEPELVRDLLEAIWVDGQHFGEDAPEAAEELAGALLEGCTHYLELGDEVRAHYDDDAPVQVDAALGAQEGVLEVVWEDREVLHVRAPGMCRDGVMAAAVRALLDPGVRRTGHSI